jgi:DNA polymerase-3 subunit epsilon
MKTRQIVLDTETTGLDPDLGHRIIEIGCVELINRRRTDNIYQQYLNPERDVDEGALEVHGIDNDFLTDKPRFIDIVEDFLSYVRNAELIIHNAAFDTAFINRELDVLGRDLGSIEDFCTILDTLALARHTHPGQRNDLDALCKRYGVDNSQRTQHGALLDAEILADVYLAMTGGQTAFLLDGMAPGAKGVGEINKSRVNAHESLPVIMPSADELAAHAAWIKQLDKEISAPCLWRRIDEQS